MHSQINQLIINIRTMREFNIYNIIFFQILKKYKCMYMQNHFIYSNQQSIYFKQKKLTKNMHNIYFMEKQKILEKIHKIIECAQKSILYDEPFAFSIIHPNKRAFQDKSFININKQNLYLWVRILQLLTIAQKLLIFDQIATKRNIFYRLKKFYGSYSQLDDDIELICNNLDIKRKQLNILASSKGIFCGLLKLKCDEQEIDGSINNITVLPTAKIIKPLAVRYKDIIIVEKQSIFQQIHYSHCAQTTSLSQYLILSSKGYPDFSTRELLDDLKQYSQNLFYLGDIDIFGVDIFLKYCLPTRQYGGLLDKIHWLDPLRLAEADLLDNNVLIMEQMQFSGEDFKKSISLQQTKWFKLYQNQDQIIKDKIKRWHQRVLKMSQNGKKIELQTIAKASKSILWVRQIIDRNFYD